jgi:hypothetical protein
MDHYLLHVTYICSNPKLWLRQSLPPTLPNQLQHTRMNFFMPYFCMSYITIYNGKEDEVTHHQHILEDRAPIKTFHHYYYYYYAPHSY